MLPGNGREEQEKAEEKDWKRMQGNFRGDGYIHYLDCGNDFTSVYICQNTNLYTLNIVFTMSILFQQSYFRNISKYKTMY